MSSDEATPGTGRRRRRSVSVSTNESRSEGESNATQSGPSSRTTVSQAKRQRLADGSANPSPRRLSNGAASESPSPSPSPPRPPPRARQSAVMVDFTKFQPGAIVRVSVENFVTYEKAEFFPGPHLNLVIGPNGTGKSSLVCAICLGLGYSPKHLGRAQAVKEFVKHGKDNATIEIELQKRPQDRANFVVKVQIRREQNSQKWWLNGKETTHKAVEELMGKLRIQVDNLCQFLPQDRVVEFAASTPVALLHETMRAAAPEEMQKWHGELQGLHRDKREIEEKAHDQTEALKTMRRRQEGIQSEVDRFHEREDILKRVKDLQAALVIAQYQEARVQFAEAKNKQKEAAASLRRLERESGPSVEAVSQKKEYADAIDAAIPSRSKALKDAVAAAERLSRDVGSAEEKIKEGERQISAERKRYDQRKKEVSTSKLRIRNLQRDLSNKPADVNFADWNHKIRAEEHMAREVVDEQRKLDVDISNVGAERRAKEAEKGRVVKELEALGTREGQQLSFMRRRFPELAQGWDWVRQNQDQFEKQVFGPPIISCSMKDERYSDQVQSLLQNDDFLCFTAQTKNDYKKLTDQLYRAMSLSVVVRTCLKPLASFRPPVGAEEASSLGLDGFAIDYLEGPEAVLAMLCAERRLHLSGVSLQEQSKDQYERLAHHNTINNWATGGQFYSIRRRREYGPNAMTTVAKHIQPGQFWTSQPVSAEEKAEMTRRQEGLSGEMEALKDRQKDLKAEAQKLEAKQKEIGDRINDLKAQKSSLQKELQKWQMLPQKIESEELHKQKNEELMAEARQRIHDLSYEGDALVLERAKIVLDHRDAIADIRTAHRALLDAKIRLIEANSDIAGLTERNRSIMQALEEEKVRSREAAECARLAREKGREVGSKVSDLLAGIEPEERQRLQQLSQTQTAEDFTRDISAEEANLELIQAANPDVLAEYERREAEIAKAVRKMEQRSARLAEVGEQLAELKAKWEPRLDELIRDINDAFAKNFERIGCAGEVRVHKDADFDQWALQILVKFREGESLAQLNEHRQSGGERSVSTIFYLLALQSMAQAPFRVVDEINQGMDPRNERMMHERMVEIACREHTSQYFLITPKLLTGLRYEPQMRVLCIASGERMPKEGGLDFRRCVDIQRRVAASAAG